MRKVSLITLFLLGLASSATHASESNGSASQSRSSHTPYWSGDRVSKNSRGMEYTSSMHEQFADIRERYREGGIYYYRDDPNTFGQLVPVNTSEELIRCTSGAVTFTAQMVASLQNNSGSIGYGVKYDAASFGGDSSHMKSYIKSGLLANSNNTTKGRFCYRMSNPKVHYRDSSAEDLVYCPKNTAVGSYTDEVSGKTCNLTLDVDLKVGEVRFLKQLQATSGVTIAQGFVSCDKNIVGNPVLSLVENGDGCDKLNRESCNYSCDWAQDVACMINDMPSWGAGKCRALGTVIFDGETLEVQSQSSLSERGEGFVYEGEAVMKCAQVSGKAQWVVESSTCEKVNFD